MPIIGLDVQIKLQGTAISRINNAAKAGIRDLMDDVVLPAARSMSPKGMGPEEPGHVHNADSLSTMTKSRGSKIYAYMRSNSGHGGYLEKGTSKMAARPYMKPAFDQSVPAAETILRTRMEQFSELDQMIADGGIQGLKAAVQGKKWKLPRKSRKQKGK
jgi:HK97 gp10 family phage protein